ncbi:class II aldolase/adducin family protein [Paenibacillus sp. J5C_2022]|uniref:class II aldolase/adducin family protein n=1 Tax=Paenibacillus sp. J5C2022 TaxID=2977129 RepID=UPI0021CF350C|nr:class II aldolase/adducin family protein [Paenibacillus sp. J5C2022]MCU6712472.1 class II aldolase/adducin family protein [Paenibacillus sp. J5C2022]
MDKARALLSSYAKKIVQNGLVAGPGGNLSIRTGEWMLISPSGFDLAEIDPSQWCAVDIASGRTDAGSLKPSSELLLHLQVYRTRLNVQAIVHTHPIHCIALGLVSRELPVLFPDQAALLGEAGFVDYVIPTTQVLADAVAEKAASADTLLLGNHGLVTLGTNLREAYYRTEVAEASARIFLLSSIIGTPKQLSAEEVRDIQALSSEAYRVSFVQNQS